MPNVSFDVFFDKDFINITATRGIKAPKAKPEWKVRTAPKLPPKETAEDTKDRPHPPARAKLTSTRQSLNPKNKEKVTDVSDTASQTSEKTKRKPPKLGPKKSAAPSAPKS